MTDRADLFRQATLAICGSLRIEEAMAATVTAIQREIPVDRMFLQIYEPTLGAMRTIAIASADQGEQLDQLTPLPPEAQATIRHNLTRIPEVPVLIDSPETNPIAREMLRFHGLAGWSLAFYKQPFCDWKHGTQRFKRHASSAIHKNAEILKYIIKMSRLISSYIS